MSKQMALCIRVTPSDGYEFGTKITVPGLRDNVSYEELQMVATAENLGRRLFPWLEEDKEAMFEYISEQEYERDFGENSEEVPLGEDTEC